MQPWDDMGDDGGAFIKYPLMTVSNNLVYGQPDSSTIVRMHSIKVMCSQVVSLHSFQVMYASAHVLRPMEQSDCRLAAGETGQSARQQQSVQDEAVHEEAFDPWAPLDMYDSGNMPIRPFRRANRLPKFRAAAGSAAVSSDGGTAAAALGLARAAPAPPAPGRLVFVEFASVLQRLQAAARAEARCTAVRPARRSAFVAGPLEDGAPDDTGNGSDYGGA